MAINKRQFSTRYFLWVFDLSTLCVLAFLLISSTAAHSHVRAFSKASHTTHSHAGSVYATIPTADEKVFDPVATATIFSHSIVVPPTVEKVTAPDTRAPVKQIITASVAPKQGPPFSPSFDSVI